MVASNTTSNLLFTSHSSARGVISPQLMPTTCNLLNIFVQFGLSENYFTWIFFWQNFTRRKKRANYGSCLLVFTGWWCTNLLLASYIIWSNGYEKMSNITSNCEGDLPSEQSLRAWSYGVHVLTWYWCNVNWEDRDFHTLSCAGSLVYRQTHNISWFVFFSHLGSETIVQVIE